MSPPLKKILEVVLHKNKGTTQEEGDMRTMKQGSQRQRQRESPEQRWRSCWDDSCALGAARRLVQIRTLGEPSSG